MSLLDELPDSIKRRVLGTLLIVAAFGWFVAAYYLGCQAHGAQDNHQTLGCDRKLNECGTPPPHAHYRNHGGVLLNDVMVTPGVVRTLSKTDVCEGGSTKQFRHTTEAMKTAAYAEYGVDKNYPLPGAGSGTFKAPLYEIDHLIPLELGGADELENLWPQPFYQHPGAHEKDVLENFLHREVCVGKMDLQEAQRTIATDWYSAYLRMKAPPADSSQADCVGDCATDRQCQSKCLRARYCPAETEEAQNFLAAHKEN